VRITWVCPPSLNALAVVMLAIAVLADVVIRGEYNTMAVLAREMQHIF